MTLGNIATKARALTNTDINSYPDANLLIDLNIWWQKVASIILDSQDDSDYDDQRRTDYPTQTTPLLANQRDYSFGVNEKVLKYKRIDVAYDGTHFYRAIPIDDGTINFGMGNDTYTDQYFIRENPRYDVKYGSIWLYPMPTTADAVSGVLRAEWERNVLPFLTSDYTSVLTDSTVVPGFDDPFHPILAYGAAFEYAASRNLPQLGTIEPQLQDWEGRLRAAYGKKDLDVRLSINPSTNNLYS